MFPASLFTLCVGITAKKDIYSQLRKYRIMRVHLKQSHQFGFMLSVRIKEDEHSAKQGQNTFMIGVVKSAQWIIAHSPPEPIPYLFTLLCFEKESPFKAM